MLTILFNGIVGLIFVGMAAYFAINGNYTFGLLFAILAQLQLIENYLILISERLKK